MDLERNYFTEAPQGRRFEIVDSSRREKLKQVVEGVGWVYAVGVLGFFALRVFLRELSPLLALINSFAPFLFLPLSVIVPLALWMRSKQAMITGAIVLILFIGLYGPLFFPRPGSLDQEMNSGLRVMTFNLRWGRGQPEALLAIIEEQEADIVAVQEMTAEMAELLEQELEAAYPYTILRAGVESTGLLSRYSILEEEWIELSEGGESNLHAIVDWDGVELNVFAVDCSRPELEWYGNMDIPIGLYDAVPQRQAIEVAGRVASTEGLTLMLGDFNISDQTRAYAEIVEVLEDSYREGGWGFGFTFPRGWYIGDVMVPGPLTRFDYIFHSEGIRTSWARVGCSGASDHCYVLAQLEREIP